MTADGDGDQALWRRDMTDLLAAILAKPVIVLGR